jgi:8-oxo-dGTP pyrophosphatase MutT (NUDIX family)
MHDRFSDILSLLEKIPNEEEIKQNARLASVVIILLQEKDQESRIVLIKRTQYDGHHSEQMAFPGGKKDTSDPDLSATARREVSEEIGIQLEESKLISLNPHWIPISNYWIQPYYIEIDKKLEYTLNKREINSIFEIPVSFFKDPAHLNFHELQYNGLRVESPRYLYEGHEIWGATALIIYQFIKLIDSKLI